MPRPSQGRLSGIKPQSHAPIRHPRTCCVRRSCDHRGDQTSDTATIPRASHMPRRVWRGSQGRFSGIKSRAQLRVAMPRTSSGDSAGSNLGHSHDSPSLAHASHIQRRLSGIEARAQLRFARRRTCLAGGGGDRRGDGAGTNRGSSRPEGLGDGRAAFGAGAAGVAGEGIGAR